MINHMDLPQFYEDHVDKVYKFFYIKNFNKQIAEDLTSQTFIEFMQQMKIQSIDQPTKYLYGIMRYVWIGFLREKYQQEIVAIEGIEDFEDYSTKEVQHYESATSYQRALDLLKDLPTKQQEVLRIRIVENRSVKETAAIMGKDSNYVKTMHHRALVTLRSRLQNPLRPEGGA